MSFSENQVLSNQWRIEDLGKNCDVEIKINWKSKQLKFVKEYIRLIINFDWSFSHIYFAFSYVLYPLFLVIPRNISQPAITCSKLTIETLEQGVKYAQT